MSTCRYSQCHAPTHVALCWEVPSKSWRYGLIPFAQRDIHERGMKKSREGFRFYFGELLNRSNQNTTTCCSVVQFSRASNLEEWRESGEETRILHSEI